MRPVIPALVATVALVMGGCTSSGTAQSDMAKSSDRPRHDHSTHNHDAERHAGESHHEHPHVDEPKLTSTLLTPSDLPPGYVVGAHHHIVVGAPGNNSAACTPIRRLLTGGHSAHHRGRGDHPQGVTVLSKSHFGPQIMHRVVDYGTDDAAQVALAHLRDALRGCRRYVHSTSAIGANTYRVLPGPGIAAPDEAVSLRLTTVDEDFTGTSAINWDVWSTRVNSRVLTIAFRSAPGGDNTDFRAAVRAALTKHQTTS